MRGGRNLPQCRSLITFHVLRFTPTPFRYTARVTSLPLHEFHETLSARFTAVNGAEFVEHYGDPLAEHRALRESAGVLDLSSRARLCLTGADRARFLNGQVTNDVKNLAPGSGCYAALVNVKGKMQADLFIHGLAEELLLDFEPGLAPAVAARFEKFIIADNVQVVDVAPHYGLLSVQGPRAAEALGKLGLGIELPVQSLQSVNVRDTTLGEIVCARVARGSAEGFDLFVPTPSLGAVADKLVAAAREVGGCAAGWQALETLRIEAGVPRFGIDMDETTLPPEAGIEGRAVSYSKGCYIGQEIIARIRTYGQVARSLRGLRLPDDLGGLPACGEKLFHDGREVGFITSAVRSPALGANIALGYVRRECNQPGTTLTMQTASGNLPVHIVTLPFVPA